MSSLQERGPVGDVTLFTAVDRTTDPGFFTHFLDQANQVAQTAKPLILEALRLEPGRVVLDLGCGTGDDVIDIAQRVGPDGRVVGLDVSEALIAEAQRRWRDSELPIEFRVGDAQELEFEDASFDACRTERMLMHVPDEQRAIAEMVRVTRRGGRVAAFDFDWDTHTVDSPDKDITRTIVRSFSDGLQHGWIGRQLPRLFREQGLTDVTVVPHHFLLPLEFYELLLGGHLVRVQDQGLLSPEKVERWWTGLRARDEHGEFLATLTAFIVAGSKS
ncbi:MAG: methyltransferase domain-containing protein [Solirubrobacterales bacterium]|nr:methyltransferase domain-containing protein [Solirubrobacterales bacterium]